MANQTQQALAEALAVIDTALKRAEPVRQSTPAEMAAARAAARAGRDAALAPKVARLAAAPADMSSLSDDVISGLIYSALAFYPTDTAYDLAERVSIRAHAERERRAAPALLQAAE